MADLSFLWHEYYAIQEKINELEKEIRKLKENIASLTQFISEVIASVGTVHSAINNRKLLLSELDTVSVHCPPADKYQKGMNDSLSGIGMYVVIAAMSGLQIKCGLKIAAYEAEIKAKEAAIKLLKGRMEEIKYLISIAATNSDD